METNSIDPVAQTLTHAIAMQEGGGKLLSYDAKSGDVPTAIGGRYQFIPDTWKNYAQQVLGDANAPMTDVNQNKVAYTKIKQWLDSGKTPAQASAMWNAGEGAPNAWKPGTAQKVGNTPRYTKNVQKYAQQLSGQLGNLATAPTQPFASANISQGGYAPPVAPSGASQTQTVQTDGYAPPAPPPPAPTDTSTKTENQGTPLPGQPFHGQNVVDWSSSNMPTGGLVQGLGALIAKYTTPGMGLGGVGGTDAAKNVSFPTAEQVGGSALQTGADLGAIASIPFTGGLSAAGLIGTSAGLGAAQSAGGAMQQNAPASEVGKQGLIGGAISAATAGILGLVTKALGSLAAKSVTLAVRPTTADFADGYNSQFAIDNGLTGNAQQIADKTRTFIGGLISKLQGVLGNSDKGIDLAPIFDTTNASLKSQSGLESNFLQNTNIQSALEKLQNEVLQVNPTGQLSLPGAQTVKQMTGMFGEWLNGAPDPEANAMSTVANTFYHNLKVAIEKAFPEGEIANINEQIQNAIPIMRAAIRRIPVAARAQALSLSDMLSFLGFSATGGASAAIPAIQHGMSSGLVSSIAPKVAGMIPGVTPAISTGMPGLLQNMFPQKKL